MVVRALDAKYHILHQRIRSARVDSAAIVIMIIVVGDLVLEVNDEGVGGGIESVHWWFGWWWLV